MKLDFYSVIGFIIGFVLGLVIFGAIFKFLGYE